MISRLHVLDDLRSAVDRWPEFADKHGIAKTRMSEIKRELTRVAKKLQWAH